MLQNLSQSASESGRSKGPVVGDVAKQTKVTAAGHPICLRGLTSVQTPKAAITMKKRIKRKLVSIVSSIIPLVVMTPPIIPWRVDRYSEGDERDGDIFPRYGRRYDERDEMRDEAPG